MANVETAWLAGLLEGDGSFERVKNGVKTVAPTIRIAMLDKDIIERVAKIFGTPVYSYLTPKGDKLMWRTQLSKREKLKPILEAILPLMGERRKLQIESMLNYFNTRGISPQEVDHR